MTLRIILLALAFALATAVLGWWAVPVLGAVWGWVDWRSGRVALTAAAAAGVGWAMLLLWTAAQGPVAELAGKVGAVMSLPGWALILLTLVFAVILAGSAAEVARWVSSRRNAGSGKRIRSPDM